MELDPDVRAYYERGEEVDRLRGGFPSGPLEFERTQEIIRRRLPASRHLRILDVGGAAGAHAQWLTADGHHVRLVDPVPLHVEQAAALGIDAQLGDARELDESDASVDVVLLLGPLYHLLEASDRDTALREARRVLRPGGLLFAAAIGRFAALVDLLVRQDNLDDDLLPVVAEAVRTGVFRGGHRIFTNAYFHLPSELQREVADAGFAAVEVLNVEGPGVLVRDFEDWWGDPDRRQILLEVARLVESEAEGLTVSHLLACAHRPTAA